MQALAELGGGDFHLPPIPVTPTAGVNNKSLSPRPQRHHRRVEATYLLRLEHLFSTPRDIANVLGLPTVPQLEIGNGEDGEAHFCRLSQSTVDALDSWVAENWAKKKFTKVRLAIAHKDPFELPVLGRDPTLPHHRPLVPESEARISPEYEYPVHYFFYGTLASSSRLSRLFGIPSSHLPELRPPSLLDGQIRTWAGKYRALVDCPGGKVEGYMYIVESADQEDALRVYEGDSYEIVRARFVSEGEEIERGTFRFWGYEDELTG